MVALKELNGGVTETGWKIDVQTEIDLLVEALREDALEKLAENVRSPAEDALDEMQRLTESEYQGKSALEKLTETHKELLEAMFVHLERESEIWGRKPGTEERNSADVSATAKFLEWNEVIVGLAVKAERDEICALVKIMHDSGLPMPSILEHISLRWEK
jgi:hypothetical protein